MKWLLGALALGSAVFLACDQPFAPETAIVQGTLDMYYYYDPVPPAGDIDSTLVRLFTNPEFTGTPVATVAARRDFGNNVVFRFDEVVPGTYYVQAWKDLDSNGIINGGDLYGVYIGNMWGEPLPLGVSHPDWPYDPTPLHVVRGTVYQLGIWVEPYPPAVSDLVITASGRRLADKTGTIFRYQLNLAAFIDTVRVQYPTGSWALVFRGFRLPGGQVDSIGLLTAQGDTTPAGEHILTFYGQLESLWSLPFVIDVSVSVP